MIYLVFIITVCLKSSHGPDQPLFITKQVLVDCRRKNAAASDWSGLTRSVTCKPWSPFIFIRVMWLCHHGRACLIWLDVGVIMWPLTSYAECEVHERWLTADLQPVAPPSSKCRLGYAELTLNRTKMKQSEEKRSWILVHVINMSYCTCFHVNCLILTITRVKPEWSVYEAALTHSVCLWLNRFSRSCRSSKRLKRSMMKKSSLTR